MRPDATPGQLTTRQGKAVAALLTSGDVPSAAAAVGVDKATLYRWMRQPAFLEAVRTAEAGALDELSRSLVRLGRTAAGTLEVAMGDSTAPWPTRVRAADAVLGRLLQLRELATLATLEARVAELERSVGLDDGR